MLLLFLIRIAEWPSVWAELFIRFIVCVLRGSLSIYVCVFFPFCFWGWDEGFDCISS